MSCRVGVRVYVGLDDEMKFGDYANLTVRQVLEKDPGYLRWAIANVRGLYVMEEVTAALKERVHG